MSVKKKKILVLQGPNLNLLGQREPEIYGHETLETIHKKLKLQLENSELKTLFDLECFQTNAEFELINKIQQAPQDQVEFILINPAALGHTSVALRDALLAIKIPFLEIHLSNIFNRESFRSHTYLSDIAVGLISGLGAKGYGLGLSYALETLRKT